MRTRTRRSGGPLEEALKYINVKDKEASFCVLQVAQKGRGVITTTSFAKGQFLLQYSGKLCTWKEGDALEEKLSSGFRFFFQFKGKKYCIDSTQEPSEGPMLGRLVNHGERQEINTKIKIVNFHDTPAMCLFALRDINKGEELLYDYGVTNLPWKKKHTFEHERIAVTEAENSGMNSGVNSSCERPDKSLSSVPDMDGGVNSSCERPDKSLSSVPDMDGGVNSSCERPDKSLSSVPDIDGGVNSSCEKPDKSLSSVPDMDGGVHSSCEKPDKSLSSVPDIDGGVYSSCERPDKSLSSGPCVEEALDLSCKKPGKNLSPVQVMEGTINSSRKRPNISLSSLQDKVDAIFLSCDQSLLPVHLMKSAANSCDKPDKHLLSGPNVEDAIDLSCKKPDKSLSPVQGMKDVLSALREKPEKDLSSGQDMDCAIKSCDEADRSLSSGSDMEVTEHSITPSCERQESLSSGSDIEDATNSSHANPYNNSTGADMEYECSETESVGGVGPTVAEAWQSDVDSSEESSDDSGDESFVPDSEDSDSDHSEVIPMITMAMRKSSVNKSVAGCSKDSEELTGAKVVKLSIAQESKVYVMKTNNTSTSRSYDKPAYCYVCSHPHKKLIVHMTQHSDESFVAQWLAAKGTEKDKLWTKIRNLGNHLHNYRVLKEGEGPLIVVYRPSGWAEPSDYQPCVDCLGYYSRYEFYRHKCKLRKQKVKEEKRRGLIKQSRQLLPPPPGCKEGGSAHTLLGTLRADDVSLCIKGDPLIMDLAKKLCFKHGHDQEQFGPLRTKLRQVARLLLEFRLVSKIKDASLLDLFFPPRFCIVLAAVRSLSGFDDETHTYMKPSLAIKIGHTLKKVAMMLVSQALIEGNTTKETEARSVHTLLTENWDVEVSSHALRTIYQGKRNNPKLLPLTSDVVLLTKYLKEESENSMNDLSAATSPEEVQNAWKKLSNVVLTQLMLFNRKRQGEISKLSVADYSNIKKGSSHVLDAQALSKFEQDLVKVMWRVEIVGKRGRTVPVLITEEMKKVLDELVKLRSDVGVSSSNQFVFAVLEGSNHHIRGCDSLRTLSSLSGAQRPDLLRSTQLRKHIAVMSQVMALKENELDVLANFLGHDVRIHREFYRLPDPAIQVAKVSKLLVALEGNSGDPGTLLQGRNLDELELNQDEEIQENQIDESEEESEETEEQSDLLQAKQTETGTKHPLVSDESMTIRKKFKESPLTKTANKFKTAVPSRPKKVPWSEEEQAAVKRHLGNFIAMQKLPGKEAIQATLKKERCLQKRNWRNVKDFVRNSITSRARKSGRGLLH